MRYESFEDVPAWQDAIDFAEQCFQLFLKEALRREFTLKDQLGRAAISISNNIAEGFERETPGELVRFLYFAKGSAGESRSMLRLLARLFDDEEVQNETKILISDARSVSKQLGAWIQSLKNRPD